MASTPSTLLTRADLDDFPDDGRRRELLDGVLIVSPLARLDHQRVVARITARLVNWLDDGGHGDVFPGANVELDAANHLEPDVVWTREQGVTGLGFDHTPAFIVEVLSPGTRVYDAGPKRDRYATTGAEEFWIVDIDRHTVEVFHIRDAAAGVPDEHSYGDTFTSPLFPGLAFDVDDLLG